MPSSEVRRESFA